MPAKHLSEQRISVKVSLGQAYPKPHDTPGAALFTIALIKHLSVNYLHKIKCNQDNICFLYYHEFNFQHILCILSDYLLTLILQLLSPDQ